MSTQPPKALNLYFEGMIHFGRIALGLPASLPVQLTPLEARGSERSFYRLRWGEDRTAILIHYDPSRTENRYYADIALFLDEIGVPVPKLFHHDPDRCLIAMEDLGQTDLWAFREASWETRRRLYTKTLSAIHRLHRLSETDFPHRRPRFMEGFGPALYRWEQNYFKEHFVRGVCGIDLDASEGDRLEAELSNLSERLQETRQTLIHRDLQSKNVMIREGEPYLIDFQGMRSGSPFYDLGSLLCDPYVRWTETERMELLLTYYRLENLNLSWKEFEKRFWEASIQRLMQALGAFGFLGLQKGIEIFLTHIPMGLQNLQEALHRATGLPTLSNLVLRCQESLRTKGGPL